MQKLMGMLKVIYENLLMLHHNVCGDEWYSTHEKMAEYYDKIGKMSDSVIETCVSLGVTEPNIESSLKSYPSLIEGHHYTKEEAYQYCYNFFTDLIKQFEAVKAEVPGDVYSEFESDIYWLRIEANYKIAHVLKTE